MVLPLHRAPVPRWGVILGVEVGIRPILSPVASNSRQILKLTISLVLLGLLSGCGAIGIGVEVVSLASSIPNPDSMQNEARHNYYEATILVSNQDLIRVKYLDVNSNAQHEEALQLMSKHCGGSYIETYRANEDGYTIVEAECNRIKDS